ncbi:MAG: TetR/AcrR family transcriptional regulator [Bacilli bacterium]
MNNFFEFITEMDDANLTPKQKRILDAAVSLISEQGYEKVSTAQIAKEAGVAEGTIFRYYPTKQRLLEAIFLPAFTRMIMPNEAKRFATFLRESELPELEILVEQIVRNRFALVKSNAVFFKLIVQEFLQHPTFMKEIQSIAMREVYPEIERIFTLYSARGEIRPYPIPTMIRIVLSNLLGYLLPRFVLMPEYEWDDERELQTVVTTIVVALKNESQVSN